MPLMLPTSPHIVSLSLGMPSYHYLLGLCAALHLQNQQNSDKKRSSIVPVRMCTTIILIVSRGTSKYFTKDSYMYPSCPQDYYVSLDYINTTQCGERKCKEL